MTRSPGPWRVAPMAGSTRTFQVHAANATGIPVAEYLTEGDAAVVATAPDMLAELQAIATGFRKCAEQVRPLSPWEQAHLERIEDLIAQATGIRFDPPLHRHGDGRAHHAHPGGGERHLHESVARVL